MIIVFQQGRPIGEELGTCVANGKRSLSSSWRLRPEAGDRMIISVRLDAGEAIVCDMTAASTPLLLLIAVALDRAGAGS